MMRVARKGIIAFEARDSTLMRLAVALGLTLNYELEPAFLSQGGAGGYRNSPIPNFVTRWRECEIEKLIYSMYPAYKHDFRYFYGLSVPVQRFRMARSVIYRSIGMVLSIASGFLGKIIGKQGNSFGFLIQKNISLQPWIKQGANGALVPDVNFLAAKYDRSKYKRVA